MKILRLGLLIVLLIFTLAACASTAGQYDAARCYEVTPEQIQAINTGILSVQPDNYVDFGWWVKSTEVANTYMVAMIVHGPQVAQNIGPALWAVSGEPNAPGQILSVSGNALKFSPYPDASQVDSKITSTTDGVQEAIWCAQQMKSP